MEPLVCKTALIAFEGTYVDEVVGASAEIRMFVPLVSFRELCGALWAITSLTIATIASALDNSGATFNADRCKAIARGVGCSKMSVGESVMPESTAIREDKRTAAIEVTPPCINGVSTLKLVSKA